MLYAVVISCDFGNNSSWGDELGVNFANKLNPDADWLSINTCEINVTGGIGGGALDVVGIESTRDVGDREDT